MQTLTQLADAVDVAMTSGNRWQQIQTIAALIRAIRATEQSGEQSSEVMIFLRNLANHYYHPRREDVGILGCIGHKAACLLASLPEQPALAVPDGWREAVQNASIVLGWMATRSDVCKKDMARMESADAALRALLAAAPATVKDSLTDQSAPAVPDGYVKEVEALLSVALQTLWRGHSAQEGSEIITRMQTLLGQTRALLAADPQPKEGGER
ncbi:hypothetical protein JFK97_10765 [Chromobacterium phragmitis]|uniref:hypothetical protein n=1 Tax=Chromobacterium amazonense TaxID=1382803 RepID=UPI0021B81444|nr:hypothetical protein [Chromobacterium amazonense]MBM2884868.1 hypothetical protein [Chromobacterium amazonense]MDE1714788.1 hypothetical protein [Chromobacterium amazonense]